MIILPAFFKLTLMFLKITQLKFLFFFILLFQFKASAQCFEIESILVDACETEGNEGQNEMVRFKIGPTAQNTSNLSVNWPSNSWLGVIQNTSTATKVANMNQMILAAGGCGTILEPVNGVLPANATVVLVTSHLFDINLNPFGAITENIYIIFQNSTVLGGHFGNYGTSATRTLSMNFGNSCSDTVTYNRSLLVNANGVQQAANGATVNFTSSGNATYSNNGCTAPVSVLLLEAGPNPQPVCSGETITLSGQAQGVQNITWSAPSGSFSTANSLTTTYTPANNATGSVVITLTGINACGTTITDTLTVTIQNGVTPTFTFSNLTICPGETAPVLNTTSQNGITGTWFPTTINNTSSGSYTFTPNTGQCANPLTIQVDVRTSVIPDFDTSTINLCSGTNVPLLNNTAPNGIIGSWSPATISNTSTGVYIFTPNAGQCASSVSLQVNITPKATPNFNTNTLNICSGTPVPSLDNISPNGIAGTWSPATISNTNSATYTFTPNSGECALAVSFQVNVTPTVIPDFNMNNITVCYQGSVPSLNSTSSNGINGFWSPNVISNTSSGIYTFTPTEGQCATTTYIEVIVNELSLFISDNCINGNYILDALANNSANTIYTWKNNLGNSIGTNSENFDVTNYVRNQSGLTIYPFTISCTITNGGCSVTEEFIIESTLCDIQKGISPNGDGLNDFFDLNSFNVSQLHVYNRHGKRVYNKVNYRNEWYGQSNKGSQLPDGTYFYTIERINMEPISGWIYVIKETK